MTDPHGVPPRHWNTLFQLLERHLVPGQTLNVWLFGSRATGKAHRYSDIDILLHATPALTDRQLTAMHHDLEDSDLPYKVDLVLHDKLVPAWRSGVDAEKQWLRTMESPRQPSSAPPGTPR